MSTDLMRTAIIVYEDTDVSIDTSEVGLNLEKMQGLPTSVVGGGRFPLSRGVYRVVSKDPIKVSIAGKVRTAVDITTGDLRNPVPKPRPQIVLETDTASPAYQAFDRAFEDFFPVLPPSND